MTRYKKSNLESFSEVKMGKGLRICKIWHQILEESHNNFPESQTAKTLNTSSPTLEAKFLNILLFSSTQA